MLCIAINRGAIGNLCRGCKKMKRYSKEKEQEEE
jgi:hypothetical protein